jgi:hypothetical protein
MRPLRRLLVLLCFTVFVSFLARETAGQTSLSQPRIVAAVDEAQLAVLKGNTHPLALPQYDRGAAPADLPMNRMLLVLKHSPEQEAALGKLLDDQQDKSSPSYHQWLTPGEFGRQFGPADQDMQVITSWIQSHGFEINSVSKGRTVIEFSGSAAQVQEAFHTSIHKFTVKGEDHWANASDPQIPAALTPVVAGVHTLHNFYKQPQIHLAEQKIAAKFLPGAPGKPPQVTFPSNPSFYALGPADYSKIYNISPLYAGMGSGSGNAILIGVVGRSNLFQGGSDVNSFINVFQFPSPTFSVLLNGPDPGDLGGEEEAEATLDSTWSTAIAPPNAFVNLVVSASTNTTDGVDLSELFLIEHNQWEVMTESFGGCEADATAAEATSISQLAEEAAAQGITYIVSSDDSGAEGCDSPTSVATGPLSVNVLASTPFTVAVGGTTFDENGSNPTYWSASNGTGFESALSYIPEDVWNESCSAAKCGSDVTLWASGGGVSTYVAKPSWQSGVAGIPTDEFRDVPDVALSAASHDPYLLCLEGSCVPDAQGNIEFATVSGTSAAAPSFAGIIALLNTTLNAPRQGQVDYVLYRLAAAETFSQCNASSHAALPASNCVFNDVTSGNNAVPGETGYGTPSAPYQSGVGYDLATGLGSVNVANLAKAWSSVTFNPTATTLSLGPTANITHGSSVTVNATVAPNSASGTPTGDVFLLAFTYGGAPPISVGLFPLEGGSVSSTTNALPGGPHAVTARYGGDGTFAPSTSSPLTITISPEPSSIVASAFTADQNGHFIPFLTGPYGSFVYLRADVSGQSGAGTPTGGITFQDSGGQNLGGSFSLNSAGNTAIPNGVFNLAGGPHAITAAYTGDASFNASTSSPLNLTITPASTTITMTSSLNSLGTGEAFAATIATTSGGNPPTGTVTFSAGGNPLGSVPVNGLTNAQTGTAQATASFTDTQLANGQYTVTATYNGDSNYAASSSAASTINLQPDFSLSLNATQLTATIPGNPVSLQLAVAALDGFNGTLSFAATSCAGLPVESSCSFSPASIAGSGSTQVAVMTSGPHPAAARGLPVAKGFAWWMTGFGVSLACVVLMGAAPKKRRWSSLLSLLALASLLTLPNCGGGSASSGSGPPIDPGTPSGAYSVTVTATSGNLSHTASFTLVVQ